MSSFSHLGLMLSWCVACLKVVFVFCAIVMVRICTPRLGLGALGRLAWGSIFLYVAVFFLIYLSSFVLF
jgi:NADH:ubiquinone oxidoreductase subunit H